MTPRQLLLLYLKQHRTDPHAPEKWHAAIVALFDEQQSEIERLQKICRPKEYRTSGALHHEDLVREMDRSTLLGEHIRLLRDYFHRCNMYFELDRSYEKLRSENAARAAGETT